MALTYNLLEDRRMIDVIIKKFFPLCFKMAEGFENLDNVLHDLAKDKVQKVLFRQWTGTRSRMKKDKADSCFFMISKCYTCQLFFSKICEIFRLHRIWNSEDLPAASEDCRTFRKTSKDRRRFPTTSEDFPTTSNDNRRCRKIFDDFKTGAAMISKGFQTNLEVFWRLLERQKTIEFLINRFLSNYTRYCQLGVRNWSQCVRSQF